MTVHLSLMLFAPMVLAVATVLAPRIAAPFIGFVGTLVPLVYAVVMLLDFEHDTPGLQYVTDDSWIEELGIHYKLGVDGLSLWLIALTAVLFTAAALWVALRPPADRPRAWVFHMALAETAVLGAFMAQDLALFVLFFDLMLVPFLFLMLGWGGPNRRQAVVKMIIYTLVGSLLMLAAAVATAVLSEQASGNEITFVLSDLAKIGLEESTQRWIFVGFALAFLIKMPLFPFQGWMPDAYGQMPLPALAVFSGVLSKVAAYGFLRVVLPLFPEAAADFQMVLLVIGLAAIIYGSAMAFTQTQLRLILGYSSVAQLGFITLGIFAFRDEGVQGAILQSVNHGLVVAPLFFIVLLASERAGGSEDLRDLGGLAFRGPVLAALFLIVALATLAIPGSANFVGEFLILLGVFKSKLVVALIASTGVVLASVYMLRAYIRATHNRKGPDVLPREIGVRDGLVLVPLVLLILAFALYPQAALEDGEQGVRASKPPPPAAAPVASLPLAPPGVPQGEVPVEPEGQP